MNTPNDPPDATIHRLLGDEETARLVERGFLTAVPAEEHPLAKALFRDYRPGSAIMTKLKAYEIANELNRLKCENATLTANVDKLTAQLATIAGKAFGLADNLDGISQMIEAGYRK